MDGLGTANAVTIYTEAAPGLTSFSYAEPATEIQGTVGSQGVIGGRNVHHRLQQSPQHVVTGQHGVGLPVVGVPQMISPQSIHPMNPYSFDPMIQQEQQHSHHTHPHATHTQQHTHTQHSQQNSQPQPQQAPPSSMRLSSTSSDPGLKLERPRVKGRMTPYAFFVQERREYYRQQNVPVQFTAFSKECSQIWKSMNDEDKSKFQKLAEEDRERYRKEIAGFDKPLAKDGTRRGRRKKEPGQPKRNMCAFLHFCVVKRPKLKQENPSLSVGAMAKQLSSAWKLMTSDQKKPYDDMANRDKQRYEQQKQAYDAGYSAGYLRQDLSPTSIQANRQMAPGGSGSVSSAPPLMSPRHRRRKKNPDMPRRNMSAFMFYSLENRPDVKAANPEFGVGKLAKALASTWALISPEQKRPYEVMAQKDKDRYELELKSFKKGLYTGSTLSARDIVLAVSGKTVPPPSQGRHNSHSHPQEHVQLSLQLEDLDEHGPVVPVTHSDPEQSPPSEDELDQLCEYYQ